MMKVRKVHAKSVLNRSKIFDYCLNPFTGCQIGCVYCYARLFMRRYSGHREPWGKFVDVKVNASEILRKQLKKAKVGIIWISSVCDPYQPLEAKFEITRSCLKELVNHQFPINIQTKSILVLRDVDLLQDFKTIEVGFTISTDDEQIARYFEPGANFISQRINALAKLHDAGIQTYAFIGPLLPGNPSRLIARLEGKVDRILIDRMNYLQSIRGFYFKQGIQEATSDDFFRKYKESLILEIKKRNMDFEVLF
jgi:DNA repair photolyase